MFYEFLKILYEFVNILRRKMPLLALLIHIIVVNIFYSRCEKTNSYEYLLWSYYTPLTVLALFWEFYHARQTYIRMYKYTSGFSVTLLAIVSTIVSVTTFVTTSYYIEQGKPFSCVLNYNRFYATIVFYSMFLVVFLFGVYEYRRWKPISTTPLDIQYDPLGNHYSTTFNNYYSTL